MQYGCIGEHLTHSFSKEIHGQLQEYLYELKEIPLSGLDTFMTQRDFRAINVTMPYKQDVIPYLHWVEPTAAAIGAVNTVVNRNGLLYGYNTDFGGMADLIRRTGIDLQGKKVLILGTGGTSKTAMAVARHLGAAHILRVSRSPKPGVVTYDDVLQHHTDAHVLINTTPKGMFSREAGMPVDPAMFPRLCGAVDAVYNPLQTEFIRKARSMGVPAAGGLYMLVRQAVLASEIFLDAKYPDSITEAVFAKIRSGKENIVLTGMPGSGKSTVGKLLADELGRTYLDVDQLITEKTGMTPGEIITARGEPAFRDAETQVIREIASRTGCIIATGGGAVLREENVDLLKANGRIFFLNRPLEQLIPTADRPLSSTVEALAKRYDQRMPIYLATADAVIDNSGTPDTAVQAVKKEFLK